MAETYRGFVIPETHINGKDIVPDAVKLLPIARRGVQSSAELTIFVQGKVQRGIVKF